MELIYKRGFVSIYYDERGFVLSQWKGRFNKNILEEGCKLILQAFMAKKCHYGLNDGRCSVGSFSNSMPYIRKEFMPSMVKLGVKKIAYVISHDIPSLQSVEKVMESNDDYNAQMFEDFDEAVNWLLDIPESDKGAPYQNSGGLIIEGNGNSILVSYNDIQYLYSFEKGTAFHCKGTLHFNKTSLKETEDSLPSQFIRVHKSFIINADYLLAIKHHRAGSYYVFLKDMPGIKIPVGRKHAPHLKSLLNL